MEVWVSAKPYMLYEAVELLYAYVNRIPAGSLTQEGEYCLTEEAVQQMMDVACAGFPGMIRLSDTTLAGISSLKSRSGQPAWPGIWLIIP